MRLIVTLLLLLAIHAAPAWTQTATSKASLLVAGCDLKCQEQTIFRVHFDSGRISSTEVLAKIPISDSDFVSFPPTLLENRFVISGDGGVFDLDEKKLFSKHIGHFVGSSQGKVVIYVYDIGAGNARLPASQKQLEQMVAAATGKPLPRNTVIKTTGKASHKAYILDLKTGTYLDLKTPNLYSEQRRAMSPDLMQGVEYDHLTGELTLLQRGINPSKLSRKTIRGRYVATCGAECDGIGRNPPVLWIDNERFLTQASNGSVLLYDTTSNSFSKFDKLTLPDDLEMKPRFVKGGQDEYYYVTDHVYLLDLATKSIARSNTISLGHRFSRSNTVSTTSFFFEEKNIGSFLSFRNFTTDGYLAAEEHESDRTRFPSTVKVWHAANSEWTELVIGPRPRIIGWISN